MTDISDEALRAHTAYLRGMAEQEFHDAADAIEALQARVADESDRADAAETLEQALRNKADAERADVARLRFAGERAAAAMRVSGWLRSASPEQQQAYDYVAKALADTAPEKADG